MKQTNNHAMSKIRPYTENEMPAVHLCAVKHKIVKSIHTITGWTEINVKISDWDYVLYDELLYCWEFLDGSVCGIEEDEDE